MQNTEEPVCITPELLASLRSWEGRSESLQDVITAAPVRGLAATLDRDDDAGRAFAAAAVALALLPAARTAARDRRRRPSAPAAASCRRCRCRAACGPAAA